MRFTTGVCLLVAVVAAVRPQEEEETVGEWIMRNMAQILGISVLCLIALWCCCSIYAGRSEKKAQERRRQNRQEQEEEELSIQTSLYNRQEEQQRKILQILQDKLTEKMKLQKSSEEEMDIPTFINEKILVNQMHREELEAEFAKVTPDQIEQLDEESKNDIKIAQDNIAQLEEKLELY